MLNRSLPKLIACMAFTGTLFLLVGTFMHPSDAAPSDAVAAFAEYAADHHWVVSHLVQLLGVVLLFVSLSLFSRLFASEWGIYLTHIGSVLATVSIACATALQAVDGIALGTMTRFWAETAQSDRAAVFAATFGVRQIEIGLASMFGLVGGITVLVFAAAIIAEKRFPLGLGWLAVLGGFTTTLGGLAMAYSGFSETAMMINMPANSLLLVWAIALCVVLWRRNDVPNGKNIL